jgi:hypothetical protein
MSTCHNIVQDIRTVVKEEVKYMCSVINKIVAISRRNLIT